jgi:hypothetical protein
LPSWKAILGETDKCAKDNRQLVIMVYDKDQFSSDDVIGCVLIPLSTLSNDSELDAWLPIVRPMTALRWNWRTALQTRLMGKLPQPELKLKVKAREIGLKEDASANVCSATDRWCRPSGKLENAAVEEISLKGSAKLLPEASDA